MMEKQVVGERASEYLDGKASCKAGPSNARFATRLS